MNYDESELMHSSQIYAELDEWEWDALTGRFQDYILALLKEKAGLLAALERVEFCIPGDTVTALNTGTDSKCPWCGGCWSEGGHRSLCVRQLAIRVAKGVR